MKNTSTVNTKEYECPSLRFCSVDVCGFICVSKVYVDEDEWVSMDGGELIFE